MMQDKAIRTFGKLSIGMIVGMIAACAGGDTPVRPDGLDEAISNGYGLGSAATGSVGPGGTSGGGTGGRAPTPPSNGGTSASGAGGTASAGTGGSASAGEAGSGASEAGSGGTGAVGGSGSSGGCDGFAILAAKCSGGNCHGSGSGISPFAASLEDAEGFVDKQGTVTCAGAGPLLSPANPSASIILQKAEGTASCGQKMPPGGPFLSDDDLACVEEWIGGL